MKRRPKADGDEDSVEDVDDEEFEKILGEMQQQQFEPTDFSFNVVL